MNLRGPDELEAVASSAWAEIAELAAAGDAHGLSTDPLQGRQVLHRLQVRAGSYLGALALNCGGITVDSKAQAEQVRSVPVERLGAVIGRLPTHLMTQLDDALRLHLQL